MIVLYTIYSVRQIKTFYSQREANEWIAEMENAADYNKEIFNVETIAVYEE